MEYKRGSEWRRWDFHLHTPDTKKNDQFKSPAGVDKWELFYKTIIDYIGDGRDKQKAIAAIGITDYFSVENYRKVKADGKLNSIVNFIFPNIELRCLPLKNGVKMNVHLLINPDFIDKVDTIVLSNLKYKTNDTEYSTRKDDLIRYGKDIDSSITDDNEAYKKGVENFYINFDDIISLFKNHPECENNILVAMPNSSVDGASAVGNPSIETDLQDLFEYRKALYKTSHLILSAKASDIDFFQGKKDKLPDKIMPCVWGCDAHSYDKIFEPKDNAGNLTKRYCWVKADPTWEGLKQVLCEPEFRVKIQEFCPADRIDNYRIIDKVAIEDNVSPHRFSNEYIYFNENLTCIIGLKSTGKSILLQNIANAINPEEVANRFEIVYENRSKKKFEFPVKVFWKDGLVSSSDNDTNKKIIYIPQSYLNKLMDDLAEKTEIDNIIENIINQSKDYNTLNNIFKQDLISIQKELDSLVIDLIYKQNSINTQLNIIKDLGNIESIQKNIYELKNKKEKLAKSLNISEYDIKQYDEALGLNIKFNVELEELMADKLSILNTDNIVRFIDFGFIKSKGIKIKLEKCTNDINGIVANNWNAYKTDLLKEMEDQIEKCNKKIVENDKIITKLKPQIDSNTEIKNIENKLRAEEENLREIEKEQNLLKIEQEEFKKILSKITNLTTKREFRYDKFAEDFKNLNFENTNENFKIIAVKRRRINYFKEEFSKIFTQSALKTIYNGVFKDLDNCLVENEYDEPCKEAFILSILNNENKKVLMAKYDVNQAVKEILKDFDNIIFTVELDGDLIENMSPGKKALVLLKLLISLDKSKYPILIDQPEDDLDNLSIVSELVTFIRERKNDRQIILVTHNANLVLGCDAEEIIVANQEIINNPKSKNKSFQFEYRSGSIENTNITDESTFLGSRGIQNHICEILEGGKEAFNSRKNKYTALNKK